MKTFSPALYVKYLDKEFTILEDGTYYKNDNDKQSLYYQVKNHWMKNTWLRTDPRPMILWSGCSGTITPLNLLKPKDDFIETCNEYGLSFYLYEPFSNYREGVVNRYDDHKNYDQFESTEINLMSVRSYELDSITEWTRKYNIKDVHVFSCEYDIKKFYAQYYYDLNLYCRDIFVASDSISDKQIKQKYSTKKIHKKFWCGNWRYNAVRHLIMLYLASTKSFYQGNYSWYVYGGRGYVSGKLWFDLAVWEVTEPELARRIEIGEGILNDVVPLSMDIQQPPMYDIAAPYGKNPPPVTSFSLSYQYAECFVAIVNESRFAQPTANFSEKILNAVRAYRPFILVAPPKTLLYLKSLGFKTFGEFWDESYDDELNHEQRLIKIFKVIDTIDSWSLEWCRDFLVKMQPIFEHNIEVLSRLSKEAIIFD